MCPCANIRVYVVDPHNNARKNALLKLRLSFLIGCFVPKHPDTLNTNGKSIIQFSGSSRCTKFHVDTPASGRLYHKSITLWSLWGSRRLRLLPPHPHLHPAQSAGSERSRRLRERRVQMDRIAKACPEPYLNMRSILKLCHIIFAKHTMRFSIDIKNRSLLRNVGSWVWLFPKIILATRLKLFVPQRMKWARNDKAETKHATHVSKHLWLEKTYHTTNVYPKKRKEPMHLW